MIFPGHRFWPWFEARVEELAQLPVVIDLGTPRRFNKEVGFLRDRFDGNYRALGYRPEPCGDDTCDYDGDLLDLPLDDASFDGAICLQVVEHVLDPRQAIAEIHRILKPGGRFLFSVPFLVSYHGKPRPQGSEFDPSHSGFPDFWRFTHEGLEVLLQPFSEVEIQAVDGPLDVRLQMLKLDRLGLYRKPLVQSWLARRDPPKLGKATTRHFCWATK